MFTTRHSFYKHQVKLLNYVVKKIVIFVFLQGYQGRQHSANRHRGYKTGRFWLRGNCQSGKQFCWDTLLDGAGGDPGHGRGPVRRQGRRLVPGHHLHWAGREEASLLQHERHECSLSHCSERVSNPVRSCLERCFQTFCWCLSSEESSREANIRETVPAPVRGEDTCQDHPVGPHC